MEALAALSFASFSLSAVGFASSQGSSFGLVAASLALGCVVAALLVYIYLLGRHAGHPVYRSVWFPLLIFVGFNAVSITAFASLRAGLEAFQPGSFTTASTFYTVLDSFFMSIDISFLVGSGDVQPATLAARSITAVNQIVSGLANSMILTSWASTLIRYH